MVAARLVVENDLTRLVVCPLAARARLRTSFPVVKDGEATSAVYTDLGVDALTTPLYRGSVLRFPSNLNIVVSEDVASGATSIPIVAQEFALADDTEGTTFAEAEIFGADNAGVATATGEVDTSSFGDGTDVFMLTVSQTHEISISGIFATTGVMYDIIRPYGNAKAFAKRELYFELFSSDGSNYQGIGRLTNYNETKPFRDVQKFTASLKVQGELISVKPT